MLRIAICEDTIAHADALASLIEHQLDGQCREVEVFSSPTELLRYIGSGGYAPDAAFLAVEADGIELALHLNELVPACRVVFVSDSLDAARDVYRAEHVWFILRRELPERIEPALHKALSCAECGRGDGLVIRRRGKAVFVPLDELLYLERDGRRTLVVTENGEHISSEPPGRLLAGGLERSFVRSHRSYWVNKRKISSLERDEFVLQDGRRIPISRGWRNTARAAFLENEE